MFHRTGGEYLQAQLVCVCVGTRGFGITEGGVCKGRAGMNEGGKLNVAAE